MFQSADNDAAVFFSHDSGGQPVPGFMQQYREALPDYPENPYDQQHYDECQYESVSGGVLCHESRVEFLKVGERSVCLLNRCCFVLLPVLAYGGMFQNSGQHLSGGEPVHTAKLGYAGSMPNEGIRPTDPADRSRTCCVLNALLYGRTES